MADLHFRLTDIDAANELGVDSLHGEVHAKVLSALGQQDPLTTIVNKVLSAVLKQLKAEALDNEVRPPWAQKLVVSVNLPEVPRVGSAVYAQSVEV